MGRDAFPLWMDEKRMTVRNKGWREYGFLKNIERGLGKWAGTKKEPREHFCPRGSGWKEAATYSPALHCSTIGASGLNFSVRNGKRWDPTAITTWCLFFSWLVHSWQVDKLFVSFAAVILHQATCLLVYSFTRKLFLLTVDWLTSYLSHLSLLFYQATRLLVYRLLVNY